MSGTMARKKNSGSKLAGMIRAAITADRNPTGSSLQSIQSYIKNNYKMKGNSDSKIRVALKKLVSSGAVRRGSVLSGMYKVKSGTKSGTKSKRKKGSRKRSKKGRKKRSKRRRRSRSRSKGRRRRRKAAAETGEMDVGPKRRRRGRSRKTSKSSARKQKRARSGRRKAKSRKRGKKSS